MSASEDNLDPSVAALLAAMEARERPPLEGLGPYELQAVMQAGLDAARVPRRTDLARVADLGIPRADGATLPLRLYAPRDFPPDRARPVVLFLHGGGYMLGSLETHDALAADIAHALDATVVAVEYRLAPTHPFPAAVEDLRGAMAWASDGPAELGHPVSGLVLAGDSAGGSLSAIGAQFSGEWGRPVLAHWTMYGGSDADATGGSMDRYAEGYLLTRTMMRTFRDAYFAGADRRHPHASPLFFAHPERLPPAMVFACALDPLRDQARAYAARLAAHGVAVRYREAPGLVHGAFTQRHLVPAAQAEFLGCIGDLRSLLDARTRGRGASLDHAVRPS